jgi:hypothetical protein
MENPAPPPIRKDILLHREHDLRMRILQSLCTAKKYAAIAKDPEWDAYCEYIQRLADTPLVLLKPDESSGEEDFGYVG